MRIDSQLKSLNKRTQHDMIKLTHIPHHPQLEFSTSIFNAMPNCIPWVTLIIFLTVTEMAVALTQSPIPTTLEGPFVPATRRFDPSLRRGSDDLPMDHPRLKKNVTSNFPEQIALAISSPTAMWVSWVTGDAQIGKTVRPLDPSTVGSEVRYGEESGKYTSVKKGVSVVYSQLYPFAGLLNYTSAIIHHVRIDGLKPGMKYYYKCGDSSIPAMSQEHALETLPEPGENTYPRRIAVVGDLGLTSNTSTTIDHLIQNDPSMILMVGDLCYANQYRTTGGKGASCFSCAFPDAPIRETYQPRWDGWGRFMEPLTSRVPMMVIEGNHEIEPQVSGITFESYLTRFAVPSEESGSKSNFYYSFDAGGVHFIMLGAYIDYNATGAQYAWLKDDLHRVDRTVTPWLVAAWHPPWYNSYSSHYQEFECMRQEMEALLYQYGVDIVFSGHVHAYERMNRVYNYTLDPCGPLYITVGDGGNIEEVDVDFADDPGKCPSAGDNTPEFGGVCHLNFSSGPAKGNFCWSKQPEWSAFRESSFGHGILEVVNSTYALWTWHRNQDTYKEDSHGDQVYIVRQPELCSRSAKVETEFLPLYTSYGLGLTTFSPLASGVLTGKYTKGNIPPDSRFALDNYKNLASRKLVDDVLQKVNGLKPIADELGVPLAQLAIAWCAANPNVSSVITGATKESQIQENMKAIDVIPLLTPAVMEKIEAVVQSKQKRPECVK